MPIKSSRLAPSSQLNKRKKPTTIRLNEEVTILGFIVEMTPTDGDHLNTRASIKPGNQPGYHMFYDIPMSVFLDKAHVYLKLWVELHRYTLIDLMALTCVHYIYYMLRGNEGYLSGAAVARAIFENIEAISDFVRTVFPGLGLPVGFRLFRLIVDV